MYNFSQLLHRLNSSENETLPMLLLLLLLLIGHVHMTILVSQSVSVQFPSFYTSLYTQQSMMPQSFFCQAANNLLICLADIEIFFKMKIYFNHVIAILAL